jgi:hypothetical protein
MLARVSWFIVRCGSSVLALLLAVTVPCCRAAAQSPSPITQDSSVAMASDSGAGTSSPAKGSAVESSSVEHTAPIAAFRPFSRTAVGVKVSILGVGFEAATPLSRSFNLRGGANLFGYSDTFTSDGVTYQGNLHFRSVETSLDWFPWSWGFHLSPGMLLYNGNSITGSASVAGGQSFTLNGVTYTSSASNPVTGVASLGFNKVAPKFTFGFGNLLPRSGRHFSVPFELGFAYTGDPQIHLNLAGTACNPQGISCQDVATNSQIQANVTAQEQKYQNDVDVARFFPIVSVGFAYNFHVGGR